MVLDDVIPGTEITNVATPRTLGCLPVMLELALVYAPPPSVVGLYPPLLSGPIINSLFGLFSATETVVPVGVRSLQWPEVVRDDCVPGFE